jgi:hypothetical protein
MENEHGLQIRASDEIGAMENEHGLQIRASDKIGAMENKHGLQIRASTGSRLAPGLFTDNIVCRQLYNLSKLVNQSS